MLVYLYFEKKPFLFLDPTEIISCYSLTNVKQSFDLIESLLDKGYYLAGFFSYELGYAFERRLFTNKIYSFPLIYLGCYKYLCKERYISNIKDKGFYISKIMPSLSFQEYDKNIEIIRHYIAQGDVYQITYCLKMKFLFEGDTSSLFFRILYTHPMPYAAYIDTGYFKIVSNSPEMFVKKIGRNIITKPMKGTWIRGQNLISDIFERIRFKYDIKNRAENLMITDLLRNDLGRIGRNIRVKRLFEVTPYSSLYQMTSTIISDIYEKISIYELFESLFPSGSVTGAPKIRSMEIIKDIEDEQRNIYTGCIGLLTPDRNIFLNIGIRTLLIYNNKGEMGVGGGVIWDSTSSGEWSEVMLKSKFLKDIETL